MKSITLATLAAFGVIALPASAQAQSSETPAIEPYVGASVGIHDLGLGLPGDDSATIYGAVAGVDLPVGDKFFVGAEANYHFGDGPIDNEYGIAARAGVRVGKTGKVFVRGGYQEVDFDLVSILGGPGPIPPGTDTSDGDYLVGAGVEFGLGESPVRFRAGIDTIAFDTTRATVGVLLAF